MNGGGGHARRVTGGVKQGDEALTCQNSSELARMNNAVEVIGRPYRVGTYLVRFGEGDSQMFAITSPLMSNGGISPISPCLDK